MEEEKTFRERQVEQHPEFFENNPHLKENMYAMLARKTEYDNGSDHKNISISNDNGNSNQKN